MREQSAGKEETASICDGNDTHSDAWQRCSRRCDGRHEKQRSCKSTPREEERIYERKRMNLGEDIPAKERKKLTSSGWPYSLSVSVQSNADAIAVVGGSVAERAA